MVNFKSMLLAATIVAGTAVSPAFAQTTPAFEPLRTPLPAPSTFDGALKGAGASSIQNVIVRVANCIGIDNPRGASASATSLTTLTPGNYLGSPGLDCAGTPNFTTDTPPVFINYTPETTNLQANAQVKYVATGSGFGRQMWREFRDKFVGGSSVVSGVFNPFLVGTTPTRWSNLQFAFSDTGVSPSDLTTYNANAATAAGAAISFPLFVLPVAIAYNPVYGINATSANMTFNARGNGITPAGGARLSAIRLSKAAYCGIFNGVIKNWNHRSLTGLNRGTPLYDTVNDTPERWAADGAPIRLVGRLDRSGTTDIFTRHLAAVCSVAYAAIAPTLQTLAPGSTKIPKVINPGQDAWDPINNKYLNPAESLPYDPGTEVDFRTVRADVRYRTDLGVGTAPPITDVAGTTNLISGDYFNGTAIVQVLPSGNGATSAAGTRSTPVGNQGSGLFLLADGSSNVAAAVNLAPDYALNGVTLNGKITYISSDFVAPSLDAAGLTAATLQVGTDAVLFANPTAAAGRIALGTIQPPQSGNNTTGDYVPGTPDARQVRLQAGGTGNALRTNPIAWTDVLYNGNATLANPSLGYPITGTTQVMLYTCYNGTNRDQVVNTFGYILGQYNVDGIGQSIARGVFNAPAAAAPGIVARSNIGVVPAAWGKAIAQTFLQKSADAPTAALNLWIADRTAPRYTVVPASAAGVTPATERSIRVTPTVSNPSCTISPAVIGTGTAAAPQTPAVIRTGA